MIKLLFSDLDGTLWEEDFVNNDFLIKETDIKALQLYYNNGGEMIVATGRGVQAIELLSKKCNLSFNKYIGSNGGYLSVNGENVYSCAVSAKLIYQAIKDIKINTTAYFHMPENSVCLDFGSGPSANLLKRRETITPSYFDSNDGNIFKCTVITNSDEERNEVINAVNNSGFDIRCITNQLGYIEILPKKVSKGEAIKQYCKLYNVDVNDIAFIGDAQNDIEAMDYVPISFCMNKSPNWVKEHAKYTVDSVSEAIDIILQLGR